MSTPFAVFTGFIGGLLTVAGSQLLKRFKLDDVVDAVSVHGFCGAWGTLAAGLFFAGDLFDGQRVLTQVLGITVAFVWTFPTAFAVFWVIKRTLGLRVSSIDEQRGLDFSEHFEIGYPEFQTDLSNLKRASGKVQANKEYGHAVTAQ
jgi:Amt family ammonium transporter